MATPVSFRDLFAGVAALVGRGGQEDLLDAIRAVYGQCVVGVVSSGRAALYLVLEAMKAFGPRDEVIIPAFVCPSVPRAVIKAGLKPILCDVSPVGFGLDPGALSNLLGERTLAVITTHLFGYPTEVAPVLASAHAAGAMVIEDAAQALGAKIGGQWAGTLADAGVISFGMSKVISSGGGLILADNAALAGRLKTLLERSPTAPAWNQLAGWLQFAAVGLLVRSQHLGPLASVWARAFRGRNDASDFPVFAQSPAQAAVGCRLYHRLEAIAEPRRRNADWFAEQLSGIPGIRLPRRLPDTQPVWLRYPVVVEDVARKRRLVSLLHRSGINVSEMYDRESFRLVSMLASRPRPCPATEHLISRMVDLPTHPYLGPRDRDMIARGFRDVFAGGPCTVWLPANSRR